MRTHDVIHGDCLDVLATMPDAGVDAFVTDPPYGTNDGKGKRGGSGGGAAVFALEWDRALPIDWLAHAARALKPGGAVAAFTDTKRVGDLWAAGEAAGLRPLQLFYWTKTNPPPTPRQNFASAVEAGVYFRKPGRALWWGGGGWARNVIDCPLAQADAGSQGRLHPTQKPLVVMQWLVGLVAAPGALVVDPFCGSGTTGVACVVGGRRFLGVERDEHFASVARARLEHWAAQHPGDMPATRPREQQLALLGGAA